MGVPNTTFIAARDTEIARTLPRKEPIWLNLKARNLPLNAPEVFSKRFQLGIPFSQNECKHHGDYKCRTSCAKALLLLFGECRVRSRNDGGERDTKY